MSQEARKATQTKPTVYKITNTMSATLTTGPDPMVRSAVADSAFAPQSLAVEPNERPALVIGDLHGHLDRLEALLKQEGLLDQCGACDGMGHDLSYTDAPECEHCDGDGWARTDKEADVVLVGDIGHFGTNGSPTGDLLTWRAAVLWADVILWGNHDRAMVDEGHAFRGFLRHPREAFQWIERARDEGKLKLAHATHGFLVTHAGLHASFQHQNVRKILKTDPYAFAEWINEVEDPDTPFENAHREAASSLKDQIAIRDAISSRRGGGSPGGGILWRDIDEKLYTEFRQVFGHSASRQHIVRYAYGNWYTGQPGKAPDHPSYCVDVGGRDGVPGNACLAGIWLPEERVVRVDL